MTVITLFLLFSFATPLPCQTPPLSSRSPSAFRQCRPWTTFNQIRKLQDLRSSENTRLSLCATHLHSLAFVQTKLTCRAGFPTFRRRSRQLTKNADFAGNLELRRLFCTELFVPKCPTIAAAPLGASSAPRSNNDVILTKVGAVGDRSALLLHSDNVVHGRRSIESGSNKIHRMSTSCRCCKGPFALRCTIALGNVRSRYTDWLCRYPIPWSMIPTTLANHDWPRKCRLPRLSLT